MFLFIHHYKKKKKSKTETKLENKLINENDNIIYQARIQGGFGGSTPSQN